MNIRELINHHYLKSLVLVCFDMVVLGLSFILSSYISSYPLSMFGSEWFTVLPAIIALQLVVFLRFGLYRAMLRYASVDSIITILKAVVFSNVVFVLGLYAVKTRLPVKFLLVNLLLTISFVGASRFIVRFYFELKQKLQTGRRVLIYGAGDLGSLTLRQLLINKSVSYSPVGLIDDDKKKIGSVIRGVKVLGTIENLEEILDQFRVEEVIVAIGEIDSENLRAVVARCKKKNIVCRIIPSFSRLVEIESDIRNVQLEDLMRRTPRDLDRGAIGKYLSRKTILITGAAGSIGSEVVRQCLSYGPKKIIAVDQSEYGLYALNEELRSEKIKYVLCDTTHFMSLDSVFENSRPDIVFHAAAYKHVPMLEQNPVEAVKNNVVSTKNLCELSDKYDVKSFVMISTDKAVRPSSVMGATKRVCELIVQNYVKVNKTKYVSVRFGNVLGSSGSVVPKFIEQIRKGGPVTVTHPDTTRFFMLIPEAVQLVLQAGSIGKGGEIFVLDMGTPVRIADMAEDLIYLMGRRPHKDVKIEFTGMRPGEKIHEELFNDKIEKQTKFKEITVAKPQFVDWSKLNFKIGQLLNMADLRRCDEMLAIMSELVPDGSFYTEPLLDRTSDRLDDTCAVKKDAEQPVVDGVFKHLPKPSFLNDYRSRASS